MAGSPEAFINEYSSFPTSRGKQNCAKLAIDSLEKPKSVRELSLDSLIHSVLLRNLWQIRDGTLVELATTPATDPRAARAEKGSSIHPFGSEVTHAKLKNG